MCLHESKDTAEQLLTLPPSFLCLASSCVMMPADVVRTMMPNCSHTQQISAHAFALLRHLAQVWTPEVWSPLHT